MYRNRKCAHCGETIRVNDPAVMIDEPIMAISEEHVEGEHLWMFFHEECYLADADGADEAFSGRAGESSA